MLNNRCGRDVMTCVLCSVVFGSISKRPVKSWHVGVRSTLVVWSWQVCMFSLRFCLGKIECEVCGVIAVCARTYLLNVRCLDVSVQSI